MQRQWPKDIADCMKDCLLALIWSKEELIQFFKSNNVTSNELANVRNYKEPGFGRAKIIDIVFQKLRERQDYGLGQFRSMMKSILEWNYFNPFYFDELKKLDRDEARRKIELLRILQEDRDEKHKEIREKQKNIEQSSAENKKTLEELNRAFFNLYRALDESGKQISMQKRGYLFEGFLMDLFRSEGIKVTESFKIKGEQIDGAIKFDGENYVIEAKWQDAYISNEPLYQFSRKVEGKMYGRGIFVSINGYTPDAITALVTGKALNTILFDGNDLIQVVEGLWTLTDMLDAKIKAAQTKGSIYFDVNTMKDKID